MEELDLKDAIFRVLRDQPQNKFSTMREIADELRTYFPHLTPIDPSEFRKAVERIIASGLVVLAIREGREHPELGMALEERATDSRPRISAMMLKLTEVRQLAAALHQ